MPLNARAAQAFESLFPGERPGLHATDPELSDIVGNFIFDETNREGSLEADTRVLIQLAALIACQAHTEFRTLLDGAFNIGIAPVALREMVYQSVPYAGLG